MQIVEAGSEQDEEADGRDAHRSNCQAAAGQGRVIGGEGGQEKPGELAVE